MAREAPSPSNPELVQLHTRWRFRRRLRRLFLGWFVIALLTYGPGTRILATALSTDMQMSTARATADVTLLSGLAFALVACIAAYVTEIIAFRRLEGFRRKLRASPVCN